MHWQQYEAYVLNLFALMRQIATFLQPTRQLRVNYVSKFDFEEDNRKKQANAVPSLRDFEFIKVIGKGGFATVYMVRKRTTGKLYAMKTVKKA